MPRKGHSPDQIVQPLSRVRHGESVAEVCRKLGISEATFYNWKAKYGGMGVSEVQKLKRLEQENAKLKRVVADLTLDNVVLKDLLSKNF